MAIAGHKPESHRKSVPGDWPRRNNDHLLPVGIRRAHRVEDTEVADLANYTAGSQHTHKATHVHNELSQPAALRPKRRSSHPRLAGSISSAERTGEGYYVIYGGARAIQ